MFAKIFKQMYHSSIAEHYKTRVVFMDMLVLADQEGVVDMTPESISAITRAPLEDVTEALKILSSPDPASRSMAHEGRRIKLIDSQRLWGWAIVNYKKYRNIRSSDLLRESNRIRQQRKRDKARSSRDVTVRHAKSRQVEAKAEGDTGTKKTPRTPRGGFAPPSIEEVKLAAAKIGLPDTEAVKFHAHYESNGWRVGKNPMKLWMAALTGWKLRANENGTKTGNKRSGANEGVVGEHKNPYAIPNAGDEKRS